MIQANTEKILRPLNVLIAEDNLADLDIILGELRSAGFEPQWRRVETEEDFQDGLSGEIDVILSEFKMAGFSARRAMALLRERGLDIPFIIVSGTVGEETAVTAMKDGAADYLMKDRLARLGSAVEQALENGRLRRERSVAEARVRAQAEMIDRAHDAIIIRDIYTREVTFWNRGAERVYGWTAKEAVGQNIAELIFVDPNVEDQTSGKLLEGGEWHGVVEQVTKDKKLLYISGHLSLVRDADGRPRSALVINIDITEQVLAERRLRLSEERMQLAMELLDAGEWELNLDTHEAHRSLSHERIFGYETLLPHWSYEIFMEHVLEEDRARVDEEFRAAMAGGGDWDFECKIRRQDGAVRWIHAAGRHYAGEEGRMNRLVGFVRDVTERKQAQEERRKIENKLLETQKLESLGVLAGGIAHDFNNLLTGVIGYASLARAEISDSSPLVPYLQQIDAASMRAADLCKQMLAYAGKGRFNVQNIDLTELVRETIHLLQVSVEKDVAIKFNLAEGLPATLADTTQLRQVVMNLVINASEAIGKGGGAINVTTGHLHADSRYLADTLLAPDLPEGDYVFLEIGDTGCGMSTETLAKIFDPFFTTKFTGRGLGLAAVLGIVRSHKGLLKVYSEVGRGTTFKVLLPAAQGEVAPRVSAESGAGEWRGSGTVLVVDDEPTVRKTAAKMLESMGFAVLQAEDGRDGVESFVAHSEEIRLVLLDLTMPRLDGEGTFRELRLLRPDVRVLLTSGFNEQETVTRFVGKGLAGFLQKPFKVETLRARLREILD